MGDAAWWLLNVVLYACMVMASAIRFHVWWRSRTQRQRRDSSPAARTMQPLTSLMREVCRWPVLMLSLATGLIPYTNARPFWKDLASATENMLVWVLSCGAPASIPFPSLPFCAPFPLSPSLIR